MFALAVFEYSFCFALFLSNYISVTYGCSFFYMKCQKQPPTDVPRKKCSKNMQQIYRRTPMPKCDFNKVAKQVY